jgi:UDP-N-acetylglucosamine 2-epimerase (non-hydrolysing)/GDP/UDP-N,N'-diacetylbacillosamine 2-epimerase (hydrolysing)
MLGNSSSGIMETPSLGLPTVNVGLRQEGRERARNTLDAAPERGAILGALRTALDPRFPDSLTGMTNPYGDGQAARRIVGVLSTVPLGEGLLRKGPVPARGHGSVGPG